MSVKMKKNKVKEAIENLFNGKEAKNYSDYRKRLLVFCSFFLEKSPGSYITQLLVTLAEIQELLYSPEKERSIKKVLRLCNLTFVHALLIKKYWENDLKILTQRKFFGVYYHSLMIHAREQYRILSGRTANTEREEAMFTDIKNFANETSNHQSENIISNAVIRYQAKRKLEGVTSITNTASYVNRLYEPISKEHKNTTIPFAWITQFSSEYQTHLECISDYLLDKVNWWEETKTCVMFYDVDNCRNEESTLQLHHFRSSKLENEMDMLQQCWDKCTTVYRSSIPAKSIKHFDENRTKINTRLTTLKCFNNDMVTPDSPLKSRSSDTSVTAHKIAAQSNDTRTLTLLC